MSDEPTFWSSLAEHWQIARTLRGLQIHFDPDICSGAWACYDVCPVDCWSPDYERQIAIFHEAHFCIACGACVLQCPEEAIKLE
jgi:NAD-dependent dihydropyrimidine dehydrogenase PreA subunit